MGARCLFALDDPFKRVVKGTTKIKKPNLVRKMKKEMMFFGMAILCFLVVSAIVGDVVHASDTSASTLAKPTSDNPNYGKHEIEGKVSHGFPTHRHQLGFLHEGDKVRVVIKSLVGERWDDNSILVKLKKDGLAVAKGEFDLHNWRLAPDKQYIKPEEMIFEAPADGMYYLEIVYSNRGGLGSTSYVGYVELQEGRYEIKRGVSSESPTLQEGRYEIKGGVSSESPTDLYQLGLLHKGDKVVVAIDHLTSYQILARLNEGEVPVAEFKFINLDPFREQYIVSKKHTFKVPADGMYHLEMVFNPRFRSIPRTDYAGHIQIIKP